MRGVVERGGTPLAPTLVIRQGISRTAATWTVGTVAGGLIAIRAFVYPYPFERSASPIIFVLAGIGLAAGVFARTLGLWSWKPRRLEASPTGLLVNGTTVGWRSIGGIRWRFSPAFDVPAPTRGRYLRSRVDTIPTTTVSITPNALPPGAATDPGWMSAFEIPLPFLSLLGDSRSAAEAFAATCRAYGVNVELDLPSGPLS